MIAFRVELLCNNCFVKIASSLHDDTQALPGLSQYLIRRIKALGWTIDGATHWCPNCTRTRNATRRKPAGNAEA